MKEPPIIVSLVPHSKETEMLKNAMAKKRVPVIIVGSDEIEKQYDFHAALSREAIMEELMNLKITPEKRKKFSKNPRKFMEGRWQKKTKS